MIKIYTRVPKKLIDEMEQLDKTLNDSYKKLMDITKELNEFVEINSLTEEEIFICDLKIINSLEEAVEKFRDL